MDYKRPNTTTKANIKPRLILHGGAGNIKPATLPPARYKLVRNSLLTMLSKTHDYMTTPKPATSSSSSSSLPSALEVATYAVNLLELNPLFNAAHGAVFTRDGINELEASVMVSRGFKKRGVGVTGLRHVKSPIALAKAMLEHGEDDLEREQKFHPLSGHPASKGAVLDVPSAQGHTLVHGQAAEALAKMYGLEFVEQSYYYTQDRWDEHIRALEAEKKGEGMATWSSDTYLPQGTTGAVALDEDGVLCCATSTGGMTNKLTGRIGDTPVVGAGFWAEEWTEDGDPTVMSANDNGLWNRLTASAATAGPLLELSGALRGIVADCLPTPWLYTPLDAHSQRRKDLQTTRSFAASGTGNGDSFMRVNAVRTASAIARWKPVSANTAVTQVTGPGGELEKSAGDRWNVTGEGQGGMISIESVIVRDREGSIVETRSSIVHDHNCSGMFRAWVDDDDKARMRVWHDADGADQSLYGDHDQPEDLRAWLPEKDVSLRLT